MDVSRIGVLFAKITSVTSNHKDYKVSFQPLWFVLVGLKERIRSLEKGKVRKIVPNKMRQLFGANQSF